MRTAQMDKSRGDDRPACADGHNGGFAFIIRWARGRFSAGRTVEEGTAGGEPSWLLRPGRSFWRSEMRAIDRPSAGTGRRVFVLRCSDS